MTPRISVIMVDGSFRERFHSVDSFAKQTFPAEDYELIWVEYYESVHPLLAQKIAGHENFKIITLGRTGEYHSSYCFNAGIVESRGELLVIPDADLLMEETFLQSVWDEHQTDEKLVMYVHRCNEPKEEHTTSMDMSHLRAVCRITNPSNYGGCLSVRRKWLLEINGYEQHPIFSSGFHANGIDVYTRLKNLGLHIMWHPTLRMYHAWHPYPAVARRIGYEVQPLVVKYRAAELLTRPFQGIDTSQDSEVSKELSRRIDEVRDSFGSTRSPLITRIISFLNRRLLP